MRNDVQLRRSFESIVMEQLDLFPESRAEDLYKLVFQAAMGCEHALADSHSALCRLQNEVDRLDTAMGTPLMMPVSPDRNLVRLHIRPFIGAGGDLIDLARAFVKTSELFEPSVAHISTYWKWVMAMATQGRFPFPQAELQRYGDQLCRQGYPAVHHSPQFRRIYRPAYRVVLRHLLRLPMK